MRLLHLIVPVAALFLAACTLDLPGEPVGTFALLGELSVNECAVSTPAQFGFVSELRAAETGQAWWRRDGSPMLEGALVDGEYRFQKSVVEHSFGEFEGCQVIRSEVLYLEANEEVVTDQTTDGSADDDSDDATEGADEAVPPKLVGRFEMVFQAQGDCAGATRLGGGPFAYLPCITVYEMSGWNHPFEEPEGDDEDTADPDSED